MILKKICMVGVFATGKTSLVRRFVHSLFSENYLATVGVKVDRKMVDVGGRPFTLLLWDLEGRDGPGGITTSYLRGASGIFYVVDGTRRETYDQLFELERQVTGSIGEVPSIVALNKSDLAQDWRLGASDNEALHARGWHVFQTSARSGDGVEEAFRWLAARTAESPIRREDGP
ncbi:MAG: Rab family GTPase [Thermoanaerobaculia bacterium]